MLARQLAALREQDTDVVALQEIRTKSVCVWREGLKEAGLEHVLDSSDLVAVPSLSGREYRRIYFNLLASRWPLRRLPGLQLEFPERYLAASVGRAGGRVRDPRYASAARFDARSGQGRNVRGAAHPTRHVVRSPPNPLW